MMMFVGNFLEFAQIDKPGKIFKVEHRVVLAVIAKERHIFTEIHVFQMIRNKAAVAPLNALAECFQHFLFVSCVHLLLSNFITERKPIVPAAPCISPLLVFLI